jgi:hypothetical protein
MTLKHNNTIGIKSMTMLLLCLGILAFEKAHTQESVNSSGRDALGSGGSVAYSIGQVTYSFQSGSTGSIEQGVQHAYEIFALETSQIEPSISLSIFPNPTSENLIVQLNEFKNVSLSYMLCDKHGKKIASGQINSPKTEINMSDLQIADYLLTILDDNVRVVRSFKIIKF